MAILAAQPGPAERLQAIAGCRSKLIAPIAEEDEFKPKKTKTKDPTAKTADQQAASEAQQQTRSILAALPLRAVHGKRLSMRPFPQIVEAEAKQSEFVVHSTLSPVELPRRDGRPREIAQHLARCLYHGSQL